MNDISQGFGSLVSLRFQKDGGAKSKQIWTNLSHWNTSGSDYRCEELLFLISLQERSARERDIVTAIIYFYITTKFHYAKDNSRLLAYGGVGTEVSYFCYICYKILKFRLKCLLTFFPIHNTSIR